MNFYLLCALLGLGSLNVARAEHPGECERSLAAEVRTLNVLWDVYDHLHAGHRRGEPEPAPDTVDFSTYVDARRFLQSLVFVPDFGKARRNDAEAIQTYLMWRFERRREAFERNGQRTARSYGLAHALDELAAYVANERYAPFICGVLGRPARWHLDIRVQPQLPAVFWPTVSSTVSSGVLFEADRAIYFLKYNGFVHVLQPSGQGEHVEYATYKIATRANVGGPLHFAYFLELLHEDLGDDLEHMTDLQDLFFNRYWRLRDLLPTGAPQP